MSSTRERVAVIQPRKFAHPPGQVTAGLRPPSANRGEERGHPGDHAGPFPDKLTFHIISQQSLEGASSMLTTSRLRARFWDFLTKLMNVSCYYIKRKRDNGVNSF